MVLPQRRDCWAEEVWRKNARLWRLAMEIWDRIVSRVEDYVVRLEEEKPIRQEFVAERAIHQKTHTEAILDDG